MSYKFSMEKVLELREDAERTCMEKFAHVQNELNQEKLILSNLEKEYEIQKKKALECKNINQLKQSQLYKIDLEKKKDRQIQVIEAKLLEVEEKRLDLVEAQKDRKIMEKLKEKDYERYIEKVNSEEQKFLDEISVTKYKKAAN